MPGRLVAVIGRHDKGGARGRLVGEPDVHVIDFKKLSALDFGSHGVRGIHGRLASFRFDDSRELIFNVGKDDGWADAFLNAAKQQMNRAKLA